MVRIPVKLNSLFSVSLFIAAAGFHGTCCVAQESATDKEAPKIQAESNYNWKLATLGGTQFWTDVRIEGGWRIQENTYFGHYRLLDDQNVRHAWGSKAACESVLDQNIKSGSVEPYRGKVVIILHGLCRSWNSMRPVADYLKEQDYQPILFRYASSREQVAQHARKLKMVIDAMPPEVTEIHFVAHSLGNIVVRHYEADCQKSDDGAPDPRIKRMVMIGPPNQGSRMARMLKSSTTFKLIAGASGTELAVNWKELEKNLATPSFEFGIIAGGYGDEDSPISNILLPGKDDFTVSEHETKLTGARDFLVRPWLHSTIMSETEVLKATARFLKRGHFISDSDRKPIQSTDDLQR